MVVHVKHRGLIHRIDGLDGNAGSTLGHRKNIATSDLFLEQKMKIST